MNPKAVNGNARSLKQIALTDFRGIQVQFCRKLVQLGFESKAHVYGAMSAHGAAGGLVGQYPVAVVLNVRNVIKRAQQRPGIKNRHNAIGAVCSAVLHHSCFDRSNAAVLRDASLQINDCPRTPAMCPEHFFASVGDLHRGTSGAGRNRRNDFQRDYFTLAAESAAHQRLDHANLRHGHLEHQRQFVLQVVRNLGR